MKYPDIFNSDISRVGVRESQMYNVSAARMMCGMASTALGPRGMEKVYIDILGEATITKHGGAFLRKVDVDHPAAKAVADAVNVVDTHVGDGTSSSAVLIGALLGGAQHLLGRGVPVARITRGYEIAMDMALGALAAMSIRADRADRSMMGRLARTCLEGKAIFDAAISRDRVCDIMVEAVLSVADLPSGRMDTDDIKIEEKPGNSADAELVMGTVLDKPVDDPAMPRRIENAKILLLNDQLEAGRTRTESEITITSPAEMGRFLRQEQSDVMAMVRSVLDSGADVVISRKGVGEQARERLAAAGIISVRRAKYNDLWWLEKSTGGSTCRSVMSISPGELGTAARVYERNVGGDMMLFVESRNPGSVTILLRAPSKTYLDEFHRTAKNAIFVLRNFVERPLVVFGGGSCEAALAGAVRDGAGAMEGPEQLAAGAFADALEEIPLTLSRNVGMDVLDVLPLLRSRHAGPGGWYGIDSSARRVADMSHSDIMETAAVKEQVIKTATEAANMILNVDDVFMKDIMDNTHCHIDGTVHAHKDPGKNHNHWEQEGLEQRQMHHYY